MSPTAALFAPLPPQRQQTRDKGQTLMATRSVPLTALSEMVPGQEADLFVLLTAKEQLTTREGKPYFKRRLPRPRPRGQLSHLGQFPLGRRLPRSLEPGRVLQGAGRLSRNQLRPATRHPQNPRGRRGGRRRRLRSDDVPAAIALRAAADVRGVAGHRPRARSTTPPLRALVESILWDNQRGVAADCRRPGTTITPSSPAGWNTR